jgi:hypothetical protein
VKAQFEEKEFEAQINGEMRLRYGFIYAPGQVLEHTIGIDAALVCPCTEFWKLFQPPHPASLFPVNVMPGGLQLNSTYWANLDQALDRFPPFKFNLFLKHKRPDFLADSRCKQWAVWRKPYFRFDITAHQQVALARLEGIAGADALVGYACPAFHLYSELWTHVATTQVVTNTNFVAASALTGHKQYTYAEPGAGGVACSEPTEVSGFNLLEGSARRRDRLVTMTNRVAVLQLSKYIATAVNGLEMESQLDKLTNAIQGNLSEVGRAFLRISAFAVLTGTSWMIG